MAAAEKERDATVARAKELVRAELEAQIGEAREHAAVAEQAMELTGEKLKAAQAVADAAQAVAEEARVEAEEARAVAKEATAEAEEARVEAEEARAEAVRAASSELEVSKALRLEKDALSAIRSAHASELAARDDGAKKLWRELQRQREVRP